MSSEELRAWDWIAKMAEKITFIRLNTLECRDITEEDYEILKIWYKQWWLGTHPLFQTKMDCKVENVSQADLFTANMTGANTTSSNGTEVEYTLKQHKKIEK